MADASFTGSGQCINISTANHAAVGPECQHAHDVQTVADAGVDQDFQLAFDRIGNHWQGAGSGQHTIELAATVVGDHDAVGTKAHGIFGVFSIQYAFDHHRAVPELANPLQVLPGNRRIEVVGQIADVVL